jgi:hypothetical protein
MTNDSENRSLIRLLATLIVFLLIVSGLQFLDKSLVSTLAPKGMYSFEVAGKKGLEILLHWHNKGLTPIAIAETALDCLFIVAYTSLFLLLFARSFPPDKHSGTTSDVQYQDRQKILFDREIWLTIGKSLIITGAVADGLENMLTLIALHGGYYNGGLIKAAALIRFYVLVLPAIAIVLKSLRWMSTIITQLIRGIWLFRLVISGLLVTFLVLWVMDQGQDLLLSVTSNWKGPVLTLVMLSIFAVCNWYLPKYYQLPDTAKLTVRNFFFASWDYQSEEHTEYTFTGRLLGAFSLMLPGACVLHTMQIVDPKILLIVLTIFYYIILKRQWLCERKAVAAIASVVLVIMIIFALMKERSNSELLGYFALDFFMISFVFLLYTNIRKSTTTWRPFNRPVTPFVIFPALAVSLLVVYENIDPRKFAFDENGRFLTLAIVFSSLIFYVFVLTIFLILGKKKKVQILTFIIVSMLAFASFSKNDYHRIRTYSFKDHPLENPAMDSLTVYSRKWIDRRKSEIIRFDSVNHQPYPVFIVNAHGGGIRAAAWTSKVINSLDTALQNRLLSKGVTSEGAAKDFQHFVFGYSCASGGTMGAAVLCAQRYNRLSKGRNESQLRGDFYKKDFLTPVIIQLFGRDLWLSFVGSDGIPDRAAQQERVWEMQTEKSIDSPSLELPLPHYWNDPKVFMEVPLLFANSYVLETGHKSVIAPVLLSARDFPSSFLMSNYFADTTREPMTLRLSTAALLTARFPFISPAGKLDGFTHFLDGGFKDNSGAGTAGEVRRVLKKALVSAGLQEKVQITMLSLPNAISVIDTMRTAKNLFEIGAPLTGAINTSVGNTNEAEALRGLLSYEESYDTASIRPQEMTGDKDSLSLKPLLPLGWQISDAALRYMDSSIVRNHKTIEWLVKKVVGK